MASSSSLAIANPPIPAKPKPRSGEPINDSGSDESKTSSLAIAVGSHPPIPAKPKPNPRSGEPINDSGSDESDDDSSSSEDEVKRCDVCLKDTTHLRYQCPYLDCIPDARGVTLGDGYELFCKNCLWLGGHAEHRWRGRAVRKHCLVCNDSGQHWSSECPKHPNPKPPIWLSCNGD